MHVAWDNAGTHWEEDIEAVVRGAAGRLVLLFGASSFLLRARGIP